MARRLTADQRREDLIEAAITEFARHGYGDARTADIAKRAGVSQPYVYALFPDKQALFVACHERVVERIRVTLVQAQQQTSLGASYETRLERLQRQWVEEQPDQALFQLQALTVTDQEVRSVVRAGYMQLVDEGVRLGGVQRQYVLNYMARAILDSVSLLLDVPSEYRLDLLHRDHVGGSEPTPPAGTGDGA
ncbi:TetR/AcrR family transcriptional regulator [Streptomyces griseorubiginosus]|uniref:TetR/AcrR family transcriptional regulator n=1 Tax=Streptomyces griseorubiginosus TaxID=67304 RepID=UPI00369C755F